MSTPARILVVEDEPNVGRTLTERLTAEGHGIEWAHNAGEALQCERRPALRSGAARRRAARSVGLRPRRDFAQASSQDGHRVPHGASARPKTAYAAWSSAPRITSSSRFTTRSCCCASRMPYARAGSWRARKRNTNSRCWSGGARIDLKRMEASRQATKRYRSLIRNARCSRCCSRSKVQCWRATRSWIAPGRQTNSRPRAPSIISSCGCDA